MSQNNEDGIIEHIFSKVSNNKYFVELGFDFSECNSLNLIKNGWHGTLIDFNEDKCLKMEKCLKFFYRKNNVNILNDLSTSRKRDNFHTFFKHFC